MFRLPCRKAIDSLGKVSADLIPKDDAPACRDCGHQIHRLPVALGDRMEPVGEEWFCGRFIYSDSDGIHYGETLEDTHATALYVRGNPDLCGPEGVYFEQAASVPPIGEVERRRTRRIAELMAEAAAKPLTSGVYRDADGSLRQHVNDFDRLA